MRINQHVCIRWPVEWYKEPAEQTPAEQANDMGRVIDIGNNKPDAEIYADDDDEPEQRKETIVRRLAIIIVITFERREGGILSMSQ